MKHGVMILGVFAVLFVLWDLSRVDAMERAQPYVEEDARPTRFPAGAISPMLGVSVLGLQGDVLTGVTGGVGYYIIDRLELFATVSAYFGAETVLTVDPGVQWVFWESKYLSPYLKLYGGPLFHLSGEGGTGGNVLGGGGVYLFAGDTFGFKLGGLAGYLFDGVYGDGFTWAADVGFVF